VKSFKVGTPFEKGVQIGPLITEKARDRVHKLVEETKAKGGKIVLGGHPLNGGGYGNGIFYAPNIIGGTKDDWDICQNEIFGPIANILSFSKEDEVIARANNSIYGLASYVFTRDLAKAIRVSEALEYGFVGINDGEGYTHKIPMGGFKQSGIG